MKTIGGMKEVNGIVGKKPFIKCARGSTNETRTKFVAHLFFQPFKKFGE